MSHNEQRLANESTKRCNEWILLITEAVFMQCNSSVMVVCCSGIVAPHIIFDTNQHWFMCEEEPLSLSKCKTLP